MAVGSGPAASSCLMAVKPPSSVAGACLTRGLHAEGAALPPGRDRPAVHGVDVARAVDEQHAAVPEPGYVLKEQPDRARLVHHHVVALVGAAPVDVDVRHRMKRLVRPGVRRSACRRLPRSSLPRLSLRSAVASSSPSVRLSATR